MMNNNEKFNFAAVMLKTDKQIEDEKIEYSLKGDTEWILIQILHTYDNKYYILKHHSNSSKTKLDKEKHKWFKKCISASSSKP